MKKFLYRTYTRADGGLTFGIYMGIITVYDCVDRDILIDKFKAKTHSI